MNFKVKYCAFFLILFLAGAPVSFAFQTLIVAVPETQVKQSPDPSSPTVGTLPQNTRVSAANSQIKGYFGIRAGKLAGYMRNSDLKLYPTNSQAEDFRLRGFAGLNFFSSPSLNTLIGSTALNNGIGGGAEIEYRLSPKLFWVLRVEHMSKSTTGLDSSGTNQVQLTIASTPVMTGVDDELTHFSRNLSLHGLAEIGFGVSTQLTGIVNGQGPGTRYSSTPFTGILAADLDWNLGEGFSVFTELGYRYLKASLSTPTTPGSGNAFFQDGSGNYQPFTLSLSGPVINFGLSYGF